VAIAEQRAQATLNVSETTGNNVAGSGEGGTGANRNATVEPSNNAAGVAGSEGDAGIRSYLSETGADGGIRWPLLVVGLVLIGVGLIGVRRIGKPSH
jgi:hypothetical protein